MYLYTLLDCFHNSNEDNVYIYDQDGKYLDCGLGCSTKWLTNEVLDIKLMECPIGTRALKLPKIQVTVKNEFVLGTKKERTTFEELAIGDIFFNEFGYFVKLSNLNENDKPIPERIPNSLNLSSGHYIVVPLKSRVILEKSLKNFSKEEL